MTQRQPPDDYDMILLGAGQGGIPLARAFARAGRRTALICRSQLGGMPSPVGCSVSAEAIRAGFAAPSGRASIRARIHAFRDDLAAYIMQDRNLELIRGDALFEDCHSLRINRPEKGPHTLRADVIVIDVTEHPVFLPLPGIDTPGVLDASSLLELPDRPNHILIAGAGPDAVAWAHLIRQGGSAVTLVAHDRSLLPGAGDEVVDAELRRAACAGITVRMNRRIDAIEQASPGLLLMTASGGLGLRAMGSHILFVTPSSMDPARLRLNRAGVRVTDSGRILVDERLQTATAAIYAVGTEGGSTHVVQDDVRIVRENLIEGRDATTSGRAVPRPNLLQGRQTTCGHGA